MYDVIMYAVKLYNFWRNFQSKGICTPQQIIHTPIVFYCHVILCVIASSLSPPLGLELKAGICNRSFKWYLCNRCLLNVITFIFNAILRVFFFECSISKAFSVEFFLKGYFLDHYCFHEKHIFIGTSKLIYR